MWQLVTLALNIIHMKDKIHRAEIIIGLVILATILSKYELISFVANDDIFTVIITAVFFVSALVGITGMITGKIWGYLGSYIFIPIATFLGISIVPFILNIVPYDYKSPTVITCSVILLLATIALHVFKYGIKRQSNLQ